MDKNFLTTRPPALTDPLTSEAQGALKRRPVAHAVASLKQHGEFTAGRCLAQLMK